MYNLIIVDDDSFIREQFRDVFDWSGWGYEVVGCFGGVDEALAYINNHTVDVLFSDIRLGSELGLTLAKQAQILQKHIEIVLVSAYSEFQYAREAIRLAVFDYLHKPVTYNDVKECFAKLRHKLDSISDQPDNVIHHIKQYIDNMDVNSAESLIGLCLRDIGDSVDEARQFLLKLYRALSPDETDSLWEDIHSRITGAGDASVFNAITVDMIKCYMICNSKKEYNYQQIEMAKAYISDNYHTDINLENVADYVNMNPAYFSRYFKKHTNERFVDYLSRTRIEQAKTLLAKTDKKVYEICQMVGYSSKHHFYKIFKQYTGITPAEYRNNLPHNGKCAP